MNSYDLNLGADENCVLQYLQAHSEQFISEMELARRAEGRDRFEEDSHWAHSALSQLVELSLVETDGQGRYRLPMAGSKKKSPARKFIDPRLREILEHSGKNFDLSNYT